MLFPRLNLLESLMIPLLGLLLVSPSVSAGTSAIAQGRTLYLDYCASCHGLNADGQGPVARALSTPPANLRLLSERYGNPLPADQIARFIDGRADVKAHGPRDMPVWGEEAWKYDSKGSKSRARDWVTKLVEYLQSIQKPVQQASDQQGAVSASPPKLVRDGGLRAISSVAQH